MNSEDAVKMVYRDLAVSMTTAGDIVPAAVEELPCWCERRTPVHAESEVALLDIDLDAAQQRFEDEIDDDPFGFYLRNTEPEWTA